ncbi:MAG: hypothetical protein A3G49_05805 [Candidatus Sungbacteria bacterium RIFCSPLOWO2_12_FULL_41_11]|uniref:Uncharacterized protein n=1 Tax=Candidatus Sungbacteria bacterium RIFCSPLOWO2_12_FULL_41_11 TaxID=1802286 RepID=A0A1G2LS57_9BACT|nr:MAG: hypothetical protein UV01_C0002G0096 [Parcubacteria group bacterium GW2011_GWA2_42_14]OGZ99893.1 MAG: hypothetical protein A3D41_01000 [Candidatus Sungbacteria bacterium RIFCSPHIGHO2_02_FULL_41_12b]OHA13621.1 MAG: hypothetical protein A3G49_05805 [Candidatus Sungbacteria bacterium RIFCSPLOWO2_12_FULL_41_11]
MEEYKKNEKGLRRQIREQTISYIVAAFGLVAGLAWNEAIKSLIEYIFPVSSNSLFAKFFYAILITLVAVIITTYLLKAVRNSKEV